jgi:O-acetyl-ADP-ribose deacetylase (regulator of RNase III)
MTEEVKINKGVVRLVKDDLTTMEADAMVFYAQPDLALGTGFGNAISLRGGPSIQEELKELGPLEQTKAVATAAGELKFKHIIHAVGPRFIEEDVEGKLRRTMDSALDQAEAKGARSVVFPPMGSGFYGVSLEVCSRVMLESIKNRLGGQTCLEEIIICVMDNREFLPFQAGLAGLN